MRNHQRSHLIKGLLCFGVLSLMTSNAQAISIDNWSVNTSAEATFETKVKRASISGSQYTTIIGKARRVIARYTSAEDYDSNGVKIATFTALNMLSHSQAKKVSGYTTVIWDGNVQPNYVEEVDSTGLGGIDFTTDGSTKFIITVDDEEDEFRKRDNASISLTVYKYNSTQSYEVKKFAKDVVDRTSDSFDLEFLFSEFGYDFTDVGALVLKIDGQEYEAMDVSLGELRTDGCQGFVPEVGYTMGYACVEDKEQGADLVCCQEKDECGICGGDNSSCKDCAGIPNGPDTKDECGLCYNNPNYAKPKDECGLCSDNPLYGKGACNDCAGVPNGPDTKDDCGLCYDNPKFGTGVCYDCAGVKNGRKDDKDACGYCYNDPKYGTEDCYDCKGNLNGTMQVDKCGDCKDPQGSDWNSRCLDCENVIWGKKQIDDCGECNDPYSSAWNSGADAKYGCTVTTHSSDLEDTENWISQQQTNYKALLNNRHYCKTEKEKRKLRTKSVQILNSVKATINNYPASTSSCEVYDKNHCTSYSLKSDNNELTDSVKKLRKRSLKALNARKNCIGGEQGQCEGTYEACLKRMRNRYRQIREERRNVEKLAKNAKKSINKLPKMVSACSCESK